MQYMRKPLFVDAIKMTKTTVVNGQTGKVGDYLLTMPTGEMGFMAAAMFEANFEAITTAQVAPDVAEPERLEAASLMICLGCGAEVTRDKFEGKTGLCVDCLKKQVSCHNCGRQVYQYEIIGTMCRKCLPPPGR